MIPENKTPAAVPDRGARIALIFALVGERLSVFYEHAQWPSLAQGAALAADWLARSGRRLPMAERNHLSTLSDTLARDIAGSVPLETGLFIAYEIAESLDPRYHSEVAESLMKECERFLDNETG